MSRKEIPVSFEGIYSIPGFFTSLPGFSNSGRNRRGLLRSLFSSVEEKTPAGKSSTNETRCCCSNYREFRCCDWPHARSSVCCSTHRHERHGYFLPPVPNQVPLKMGDNPTASHLTKGTDRGYNSPLKKGDSGGCVFPLLSGNQKIKILVTIRMPEFYM